MFLCNYNNIKKEVIVSILKNVFFFAFMIILAIIMVILAPAFYRKSNKQSQKHEKRSKRKLKNEFLEDFLSSPEAWILDRKKSKTDMSLHLYRLSLAKENDIIKIFSLYSAEISIGGASVYLDASDSKMIKEIIGEIPKLSKV